MTNNQLAENSITQLLNGVKLARDNAERDDNRVDHSFYYALTIALEELQERRKAAMDSEPVAWMHDGEDGREYNGHNEFSGGGKGIPLYRHAQPAPASEMITVTDNMAYAFHHALTDSMLGADEVEEIKTGLRAVFANLTAPVVSAECPERLPCSVLLEPGLRFGKGIKTSIVLAALARRSVYESDMAALSPEEKAEFLEKIADFKALIAQPAPVVPDKGHKWSYGLIHPENCQCIECRSARLNGVKS